jgi:hypothetical protein
MGSWLPNASSVLTIRVLVPRGSVTVIVQVAKPSVVVAGIPLTATCVIVLWSRAVPRTVTCVEVSKAEVPGKVRVATGARTSGDALLSGDGLWSGPSSLPQPASSPRHPRRNPRQIIMAYLGMRPGTVTALITPCEGGMNDHMMLSIQEFSVASVPKSLKFL